MQTDDARHRLQLVIDDYSKLIRTSREQAEMALFHHTFDAKPFWTMTPEELVSEISPEDN